MTDGPEKPDQPSATSDDLRRVRIPFVQRADLTHRGQSNAVFIIDVGLRGVFVEQENPLAVGEAVVIRFPMPGNEIPIVARCRVAWTHTPDKRLVAKQLPPGMGLEFAELSERDQGLIQEHILEHFRQNPRVRRFLRHWPEAGHLGDDPLGEEP